MVDLTKIFETTKHALEGEVELVARPYLGMSQLGNECSRYLWYQFRWAYTDKTSKRMLRLWDRGHREEPVIIRALNEIGIEVWGDQTNMEAVHGHVKGHCDGICKGVIEAPKTEHLCEFKTVKDSGFKELQKKKLKKYSATYYGQCQLYMHFLKLKRTLFIAVNKNDDHYYVERVAYDKSYAEDLIRKAEHIVTSDTPPDRAYPTKTFYKCTWCEARNVCWNNEPMKKGCRTCKHSEVAVEGTWLCNKYAVTFNKIPVEFQRIGCSQYEV